MDERGIIIADRDAEYRKEMAQFFEKAGYSVETTDSAIHVLCSVLQKQTPVLLLASDFDKKLSSAELIHLLKKCNRRLHVIMVSDEMPLAQLRQVRQEGIFYHALRPAAPGDTEEIGTAVASAFKAGSPAAQQERAAVEPQPEPVPSAAKRLREAAAWLLGMAILVFAISSLGLVAAEQLQQGSQAAIWLFLAFSALILLTQFFPIFQIKPSKQPQGESLEDQ